MIHNLVENYPVASVMDKEKSQRKCVLIEEHDMILD
jgi:hypothetical protein